MKLTLFSKSEWKSSKRGVKKLKKEEWKILQPTFCLLHIRVQQLMTKEISEEKKPYFLFFWQAVWVTSNLKILHHILIILTMLHFKKPKKKLFNKLREKYIIQSLLRNYIYFVAEDFREDVFNTQLQFPNIQCRTNSQIVCALRYLYFVPKISLNNFCNISNHIYLYIY